MDIKKLLNVDNERYEDMRFEAYFDYCQLMSQDSKQQLQIYLANRAINKWFNRTYNELEDDFLRNVFVESGLNTREIRAYYADVTNRIFNLSPKPLIEFHRIQKHLQELEQEKFSN